MDGGTSVPEGLRQVSRLPGGAAWLDELPALIDGLARAWGLRIGQPFADCTVSWVAPVEANGAAAVLKVPFPHRESAGEADALAAWSGDGAVRLIRRDDRHDAMLLELCRPGTHLAVAHGVDHLAVVVDLLPRLWTAAPDGIRTLEEECRHWSAGMVRHWDQAGHPCERRLVDLALECLDGLPREQGDRVLLHQDLHGDNIVAAEREPWLVIDPKPLAGEREFSVAPVVRSFEFGHSRTEVTGRLRRMCDELGLDHDRATRWTIAQTMAWSFDSSYATLHHETVRWLAPLLTAG